tara:strand:+ start:288 stop:794 length:507 start_codon:yes stop_codon:yes gene_type:complete
LKEEDVLLINQTENFKDLNSENNLIKNIEYLSTDKDGNKYLLVSEYGEISTENTNIISMKNVEAKIELFEKDTIYINSNTAIYNTQTYDTKFTKSVKLRYSNQEITADNLDLSFQKNLVQIYNDIIYKNPYYELFADKIEIDLLTKNSKMFMNNGNKVKIIKKQNGYN